MDFNGVVPEKFDVVTLTHKVQVEYGNVGVDFKFIPREGFGWMNASYQVGLSYITSHMRRALGTCTSPDLFFAKTMAKAAAAAEANTPPEQQRKLSAAAIAITENGTIPAATTTIDVENEITAITGLRPPLVTDDYLSSEGSGNVTPAVESADEADEAEENTPAVTVENTAENSPVNTPREEKGAFIGKDRGQKH